MTKFGIKCIKSSTFTRASVCSNRSMDSNICRDVVVICVVVWIVFYLNDNFAPPPPL